MYLFRQYFFKRYQHILTITTNTIALLLLLLVNNMSIYLNNELSGYLSELSFDVSMLQIIDEKIKYSSLRKKLFEICTRDKIQEALKSYPWYQLPIKQAAFAFAMKHRLFLLQKFMVICRYR